MARASSVRRAGWIAFGGMLVGGALLAAAYVTVQRAARGRIFELASATIPAHRVAIVPGALVFANGQLSDIVADRVACALALHRRGLVDRVLVSGDHGTLAYDEVGAMGDALVRGGVNPAAVFLDHAGFRTLDTMHRARAVFGVRKAIICTQRFHLARSVYLARSFGIDAVGVVADQQTCDAALFNDLREALARANALLDVAVGRGARMLGPRIPIEGSALPSQDRPLGQP